MRIEATYGTAIDPGIFIFVLSRIFTRLTLPLVNRFLEMVSGWSIIETSFWRYCIASFIESSKVCPFFNFFPAPLTERRVKTWTWKNGPLNPSHHSALTLQRKFRDKASAAPEFIAFVSSHHCDFIILNSVHSTENSSQCTTKRNFESTPKQAMEHCFHILEIQSVQVSRIGR